MNVRRNIGILIITLVTGAGGRASALETMAAGLHKEEVSAVIRANLTHFSACYETALKTNPELKGQITVRMKITGDGKVHEASIKKSTIEDQGMRGCMVNAARNLTFPHPRGGGHFYVNYPFVFNPS